MTPLRKGLLLAVLHLLIVGSLGAKLLIDRSLRPRVWVRTAPYDPELPIRGRYVSLQVEVEAPQPPPPAKPAEDQPAWMTRVRSDWKPARLEVREGKLFAVPDEAGSVYYGFRWRQNAWAPALLTEPVAFFIPEHIPDPSVRPQGEELWVEVTVPKKGPPRPIRLGVKRGGQLTPLEIN